MPIWYLTPASLGYLTQLIIALMITGYFVVRLILVQASRSAHTVLLTGFLACITLLALLFFLEASLLPTERLYALFLQNTVLGAGIVLLLQFAYCFPDPFPHKWEARLALGLSLLYALYEAQYAAYRFWLVSTWGQVIFRPPWADYPMALGLLWAPVLFVRQSVRASKQDPTGFSNLSGLYHLWRPQGRAARTARALALVYLLPFGLSLLTILKTFYYVQADLYQLSLSMGVMIALAAFAVIYLNYLPETTSFMVRLVGVTLVALLAVLGAVGWVITPTYAAQYRPVFPDHQTMRFTPNDVGGYDITSIPFYFESDLGANLNLMDSTERTDAHASARLDFAFPFYGQTYSQVYATNNGSMALGQDAYYRDYLYHYGGQTPFIFPLLIDLIPEAGPGGVFARQEADRLIVTWDRVPAFYQRQAAFTFQAVLYSSGDFDITYNGLPDGLHYQPNDEPWASVWLVGALPGDASQWPQHLDLGLMAPNQVITSGPQGMVHDYYLDFRRYLHTLLLPLASLMGIASLLVSFGFPSLFYLNLVRPLDTLLAGVRRVNAGDLQATMPIHYGDEIGFLTASFNSTVAKLRDLIATLETRVAERTANLSAANVRLRQEIAEREAAQAQVLEQQRTLAAVEERERLGRELHDGLGQLMGYINVQSQAIQTLLADGETAAAQANLQQLTEMAQDAQPDIRNYILGLRLPAIAPGDLGHVLEAYLRQFGEAYGIEATLSYPVNAPSPALAPAVEEQVLRIVQEALANVQQHAAARRVEVLFSFSGEQAQIIIADDGVGFDPTGQAPDQLIIAQHFGLSVMRERAAQAGGQLEIRSAPGQGTKVLLTLPRAASLPSGQEGVEGIRVLLVDDHPLFLDGLRNLLIAAASASSAWRGMGWRRKSKPAPCART